MTCLHVWVISDTLPGHFNQSIGIVNALREYENVTFDIVEIKIRNKLFRSLLRLAANRAFAFNEALLEAAFQVPQLPDRKPDIVVSAGGNTIFANIVTGQKYHATKVFSGTLKGYRSSLLDVVFSVTPLTSADPTTNNNTVLDLPPGNIPRFEDLSPDRPPYVFACLIGGNGAGYYYTENDWLDLVRLLERVQSRYHCQWLITTSRRTGIEAERQLENVIGESLIRPHINELVLYGSNPKKVVRDWLQQANALFTTEDSLTMVAESILSQKSVMTLQPARFEPDHNDEAALGKYHEKGYINRIKLDSATCPEFEPTAKICLPDILQQIHRAIMEKHRL
ncbi:MAG: hypothetical protein CSB48_03420 [Proteobacteria bacterium]|nr:MAG: hypothetical protein CSB48_03420 [Pseudomonadota bacterium]